MPESSTSTNGGNTPALTDPSSRDKAVNWFGCHPKGFDAIVLCRHAAHPGRDSEAGDDTLPPSLLPLPSQASHVSAASLGDLERLPPELLGFVMQYTDLRSISRLRLVNMRMRFIVDDCIAYKLLVRHIPDTIASLRLSDAWQHYIVADLYNTLCNPTCTFCKDFGTYLWIPGGVRCCFNCISCVNESRHVMPLIESDARKLYGVPKKALADVPSMLTLPGRYGMFEVYHGRRFRVYNEDRVVQAAVAHHGSNEAYEAWLAGDGRKAREEFNHPTRRGFDKSKFCRGVRFMAATPLPYYDPATRRLHHGLVCRGCQITVIRSRHLITSMDFNHRQARMWTEDKLFEHLSECKGAQYIWEFMHKPYPRSIGNPVEARDPVSRFLMELIIKLRHGPP